MMYIVYLPFLLFQNTGYSMYIQFLYLKKTDYKHKIEACLNKLHGVT